MQQEEIPSEAYQTVLISLVVVQDPKQPGKFVSTHEHDGWYLPAGRVDFGETLPTGARREALEEAGIPVTLTGLLRIEHSPGLRGARLRAIYAATPSDDTPLKSEPDHEIIEAKWVTIDELKKKKLRSEEVIELFEFAQSGTRLHPVSVLEGEDSQTIRHDIVVTFIVYSTDVIITHGDKILARRSPQDKWEIPRTVMQKPTQFHTAATGVIHTDTGIYLSIDKLVKIFHSPPPRMNTSGSMSALYTAHLMEKFDPSIIDTLENYKWFSSIEEFLNDPDAGEESLRLLKLYRDTPVEDLCSPKIITYEADAYNPIF